MDVYRSSMEKILKEQENETVITNPKEPWKTFWRKVAYVFSRWSARIKKLF
jgi:hypothetical protein